MVTAEDLKQLPDKPGVYLMFDSNDNIIYIGKAISLKNRVRSYFQASRNLSLRIQSMVKQVDRIEYIITNNEVEALVLECNLIKEKHPKYNIRLRDDKQYPWVKVTLNESYPQVYITRRVKQDGSKYYGPYTNVAAIRDTMKLLRQIFPLRSCRYDLDEQTIARPCLNYQIKRCLAPCNRLVSKESYREIINQVCLFLEGRQMELAEELNRQMQQAALELQYEKAAVFRDRLRDIKKIMEKQKVITDVPIDLDVFGISQDHQGSMIQVFQVRDGKLVGREYFLLNEGLETEPMEIIEEFLTQYYDKSGFIPKEIIIPCNLESQVAIETLLTSLRGSKVRVRLPHKGEKAQLLRMANENAANLLQQERAKEKQEESYVAQTLEELQRRLELPKLPQRIEGFDISNIQGRDAVASMVVFESGVPKGSDYRRFKIRTIEGPNDFAMMQEALRRRFLKGLEERQTLQTENGKFAKFPDLLLIDGGKGQLSAAVAVLEELNLRHIPIIGLAKQEEEIFKPDQEDPIILSRRSDALRLLQRVRDEAHRFAITYHKSLRSKRTLTSKLDEIPGVGPKKKQALMKRFGSVKRIREATVEELMQVPGINQQLAEMIKELI
ncbi:MAG TPA: excinuclease ABC subunit UvrC [Bacillota bacterium]|nr:excinuclease ABC subunit UvrC [Bacillota bacterium]HOL09259.1 excinuclease ABC subunit UvrC [Bacillota bacterium]HPO96922.1 excinuclease ABC subunit UvrC [Bacillota bacterium]